ncbi:MAG: hypothetical protein A4E44_01140 [Methanosaeta sp. PtaB.Bin018]|jgi:hypothetical protein|nr:hypothetical protein [Methanothrix sp.]OPX75847.1 MAG: hypothetical protein A4E44_01140 [Methanosaeta sp. PtaB.Bin018]OPY45178.1 MAG: hypothetical protein A4E46_01326 [Methanosaeta sp. PtaU1.Bin016]
MDTDSNPPGAGVSGLAKEGEQFGRAIRRSLGDIFSEAFEIYRKNPAMIIPSLLPIAALILGIGFFASFLGLAVVIGDWGKIMAFSAVGGLLLLIVLLIISFFVAEGLTIEMIKEASSGRKVDLNYAWQTSKGRMEPLILSSILAGIITAIGYLLLVIPGIILSFALYFVAQAVMIDGRSGVDAIKTSWGFVKSNLSDSIVIILASMLICIVLQAIPGIGPLLCLLSLPYIYALATLLYLDQKKMPPVRQETSVSIS